MFSLMIKKKDVKRKTVYDFLNTEDLKNSIHNNVTIINVLL